MLEHTFIHIQGVGHKTEQRLWERGIGTWFDFLKHGSVIFTPARDRVLRQDLYTSIDHRRDIRYFRDRLPSSETWRLFGSFQDKAVYLDIETSGGYQGVDEITVIGLYDGQRTQSYVSGINLEDFEIDIALYELVVTFNGSTFDLPFIRRQFPNISLPAAHIDLRFLLKRLGHRGGLKKIEKDLGLLRASQVDGMDGYDAVLLWRAYQWGDRNALEQLIEYNRWDILNLKPLMEMGYAEMKRRLLP